MKRAAKVRFALGCALGVLPIACSGGERSVATDGGAPSETGGHTSAGAANSGGLSNANGGSAASTNAIEGSGGATSGGSVVNSTMGSGGAKVSTATGGAASTGGHSSAVGGASIATGGMPATTGGTLVQGGASGGTTVASGGVGGATVGTGSTKVIGGNTGSAGGSGGTKVGSGGTSGGTAGSGSTKVASGGSAGSTAATGGSGGRTSTGGETIVPGAIWNDTQGSVLQAHGEGITKVGDTYYLIGEDKTNGAPFQNVKCYSSVDLKNWTFVNNILTRQSSGDLGPNRIIERPHVIYNASTSQFVMYMHVDSSSYGDRKAGVATCSSVCGNYNYKGSVKPLGHDSLDDTLFQDGTTGYFISEDRANTKLQIYQLSDDYLTVSSLVASLPQYESPAVVKIASTYYIFGSHLTGWSTNDNQYSTASSMAGPWSAWKSFAPSGTNTCNSQVTFILPVTGTSTTTYVFFGDRWNSNNLTDSRYIWQPLTISGTSVSMTCATSWKIDTATGMWSL